MQVGILFKLTSDVRECVTQMVDMGFHSGQLSIWDMELYTSEMSKKAYEICQELSFTITALWCGWSGPINWGYPQMYTTLGLVPSFMREKRMNELLSGAEFARKLGVKNIITHTGYIPDNPLDSTHIEIVETLCHICKTLKTHGQSFLFETGEELPLTLVQLINQIGVDNIGVNFDPANFLINARANPCDALDLLMPYVMGVHGKDGVYPQGTEAKGMELALGQGKANFPELIKKLKAAGYDGDITIEREIQESEQRQWDILMGKTYLESIIRSV